MDNHFGLRPTDIEVIVRVLKAHPEIDEAMIFGSRAMVNFKPGSDIDLALKGHVDLDLAIDLLHNLICLLKSFFFR